MMIRRYSINNNNNNNNNNQRQQQQERQVRSPYNKEKMSPQQKQQQEQQLFRQQQHQQQQQHWKPLDLSNTNNANNNMRAGNKNRNHHYISGLGDGNLESNQNDNGDPRMIQGRKPNYMNRNPSYYGQIHDQHFVRNQIEQNGNKKDDDDNDVPQQQQQQDDDYTKQYQYLHKKQHHVPNNNQQRQTQNQQEQYSHRLKRPIPYRPPSTSEDYTDGPWQISVLALFGIICVLIFLFLHLINDPTPHHSSGRRRKTKKERNKSDEVTSMKNVEQKYFETYKSPYRGVTTTTRRVVAAGTGAVGGPSNSIIRKKKKEDTWSEDEAVPYDADHPTDSETGGNVGSSAVSASNITSANNSATVDPTALLYYSHNVVPQQQHRQRKQVTGGMESGNVDTAVLKSPVRTGFTRTSANFTTSAVTTSSGVGVAQQAAQPPPPPSPLPLHTTATSRTAAAAAAAPSHQQNSPAISPKKPSSPTKNRDAMEESYLITALDGFTTFSPAHSKDEEDDNEQHHDISPQKKPQRLSPVPRNRLSSDDTAARGRSSKVIAKMGPVSSFSSFDSLSLHTPERDTTTTPGGMTTADKEDIWSSTDDDGGGGKIDEHSDEEVGSSSHDESSIPSPSNPAKPLKVPSIMRFGGLEKEGKSISKSSILSVPSGSTDSGCSSGNNNAWDEDMITPRTKHVIKKMDTKKSEDRGGGGVYRNVIPLKMPNLMVDKTSDGKKKSISRASTKLAGNMTSISSTSTPASTSPSEFIEVKEERLEFPSLSAIPPLPLDDSEEEEHSSVYLDLGAGGNNVQRVGGGDTSDEDRLFLPTFGHSQSPEQQQAEPPTHQQVSSPDIVPKVFSLDKPPRSVSLEELQLVRMESGMEDFDASNKWRTLAELEEDSNNNLQQQSFHDSQIEEITRRKKKEQQGANLFVPASPPPLRVHDDNGREQPRIVSQHVPQHHHRQYPPPAQDGRKPIQQQQHYPSTPLHTDPQPSAQTPHYHQPPLISQQQQQQHAEIAEAAQKQAANQKSARQSIAHKRPDLTQHSDASSSLASPIRFSELNLIEIIGGGGFGQVWKASWRGTPVAVKLLTGSAQKSEGVVNKSVLEEFAAEINMVSGMRHPNICLYMGACLDPPNRAIVTEFAANGSLWDALRQPLLAPYIAADGMSRSAWPLSLYDDHDGLMMMSHHHRIPLPPAGTWPWALVKRVASGAARGMTYLHSGNPPVLHRDLKSANLLLDESYTTKLCDFGLSRLKALERSMTGNCGTVQWMAPEVLANHRYAEPADVYSFGIILWEMLTGECPYEGMNPIQCALAVLNKNTRPQIPDWCPPAFAALIKSCVDKNPSLRPTFPQILGALDSLP